MRSISPEGPKYVIQDQITSITSISTDFLDISKTRDHTRRTDGHGDPPAQ